MTSLLSRRGLTCFLSAALLVTLVNRPSSSQERDPRAPALLPGRLFVLGDEVFPPWQFTGVYGDTLRLNGVPIYPLCGPVVRDIRPSSRDSLHVRAILQKRFTEIDEALARQSRTYRSFVLDEAKAAQAVYDSSRLVLSTSIRVSKDVAQLLINWADGSPPTTVEFGLAGRDNPTAMVNQIQRYWIRELTATRGSCIIFSEGHVRLGQADCDTLAEVMRRIREGEAIPPGLLTGREISEYEVRMLKSDRMSCGRK